ncbi:MAG: SMP-30/gluconolactonase/LRE family protein [Pseudomonadota bacterium]
MKLIYAAALLLAAPASAQTVIATEAGFPEGPVVLGEVLYWAEYGSNRVRTWDGTAVATLADLPGCGPSAVAPLGGDLAITCYDDGTVARIGLDGSAVARYAEDADGGALIGPNDFTPAADGGLWMTTSGPWDSAPIVGAVYHLATDGTLTLAADDMHYANGIALFGDRLYVNESEAGRVISFAIDGTTLSDRRLFARVPDLDPDAGAYPDGLKAGPDGNLWIASFATGTLVVANAAAEHVRTVTVDAPTAPNLAFSADGSTAYVAVVDQTNEAPYTGRILEVPIE